MNTWFRRFALLLSVALILGTTVFGTMAYIASATPAVSNTFVFDPHAFPAEPTPAPTPASLPQIDLPDTGDSSDIALWSAMLALSAGGLLLLRRRCA